MAAPTVTTTQREPAAAEPARVGIAEASAWWYDWVNAHRVGAAALVGVISTQIATYFGYVFPAFGLPTLPWPLYNGVLAAPTEEFTSASAYFVGQSLHFVNGIVFTILYAVLALHVLPFRNTHGGNILKGLLYSVVLTIISVGVLVPYAYVPKQGYGLFLFDGPDGWKLPFAVLVWHLIWGFFIGVLYQLRANRRSPELS
jgi:RsiW-degrading membrane proteinase PrsW (M82 family)